jgi:L-threonylcarbamoyladenylate synthase
LITHDLELAVFKLKKGEVVAFPTETVYGLGALYDAPEAVNKIFSLKKRPSDNPLIVHLADISQIEKVAIAIPEEFYRLAESFFPGPLTVVLQKHVSVPANVSAHLDTVAVRVPSHPLAKKLIAVAGKPLVAPSANLSGKPSPTLAEHVREDFGDQVTILDGGPCKLGIESTVISLLNPKAPLLLRPGVIAKEELENRLKCSIFRADSSTTICSPGMKYRHYAPKAPIFFVESWDEVPSSSKSMVLSFDAPPIGKDLLHFDLSNEKLYFAMREADRRGIEAIFVIADERLSLQEGLFDRLKKAASFNRVEI